MNDPQTVAPKPVHLAPSSTDTSSSTSSAALRGATRAFVPRISTPITATSQTSAGARFAASAAGASSRQQALRVSPSRQNDSKETSPVRGRHLTVNDNAAIRAARSSSSSNTTTNPPGPTLQPPGSSTLAARHVSVQSHSPYRSPERSPARSGRPTTRSDEDAKDRHSLHALSGAMVSMAASLARAQQNEQIATPARNLVLRPENVPLLVPTKPAKDDSRPENSVNASNAQHGQNTNETYGLSYPRSPINHAPMQTNGQVDSLSIKSHRQLSEESLASIATTAAAKAEEERGRPGRKPPPVVVRRPISAFVRSSTHGSIRHTEDYRPVMTVNSLADAMVASSLASSRAGSPQKSPPPLSRGRSRSIATLYEMRATPELPRRIKPLNPPRTMKHTLRKQLSSDDEEVELAKRGRRHWMRKHPNKHSEGNRKRWRDKVTELERKRYEGVFAANRGLLIGSGDFEPSAAVLSDNTAEGNQVVNVIVRDIWERSRLPREVLKEIYDLVSPEEAHVLNREQFVVGLWLVDQRLKGRKLPVKVSASVWASVRHSHGIKIRNQGS